jgi:carboxyl-terminal processing protease
MKMFKKLKWVILTVSIVLAGAFSFSFSDKYFEISKNLDILSNVYKTLHMNYVDEVNPGEVMKVGIDAMLESLDPYTVYYPEADIEDYRFLTTGEYGGIGSMIKRDGDYIMISEPYEGFPAQKNDVRAGDIIKKVDGKSIKGKSSEQVSKFLKGQANTPVKITIERPATGESLEKELVRENVKIEDVPYYGMLNDGGVGYIKLTSFTQTASRDVIKAFRELETQGMSTLVFDLRDNGGGLLNEAVNIVNMFVPKGQDVVSTRGKRKDVGRTYQALNNPVDLQIPLVVLVNGSSASASEIVSGAIQDLDRGVVIGQRTFGKGLVQETKPLSYNSSMKLTIAKYYIPSGRCIQKLDYSNKKNGKAVAVADSSIAAFKTKNGRTVYDGKGIAPDIEVELPDLHEITISLLQKQLIFDYATEFFYANDSIDGPDKFSFTSEQYEAFKKFLTDKKYDYTTDSEELLAELEEVSKQEKYYDAVKDSYEELKTKIKHNKSEDLESFKEEILRILENEIVSRYYFQRGRIIHSLNNDPYIKEATKILSDKRRYQSILQPSKDQDNG